MTRSRRRMTFALGLLVALAPPCGDAATKSPPEVARSCRQAIARTFGELARIGLHEIDACERSRATGRTERDCTVLRPGTLVLTAYRRWEHRTREIILARCPLDSLARAPFPAKTFAGDVLSGDPTSVIPDVGSTVQASARTLQGAGAAGGECRVAIATARSLVARETMRAAVRCQRRVDARAGIFAPLDVACEVAPPDAIVREAAGRIATACRGIGGSEIETCAPLPECVLGEGTRTGHALARLAFGQCGNGVLDGDEQCDDGNEDASDGCNHCLAPTCGDGNVEGDEECDDGNPRDYDGCTQCRTSICGDGIVDVGVESCDDGNTIAVDGCTDCQADPVSCSSAGMLATIAVEYDPSAFVEIAGMRVRVRYRPDVLAIPGSLVGASINQRVRNLTGLTSGASFSVADRDLQPAEDATDGVDDTLQTIIAVSSGGVPPGPFELVRFDCLGSEARASDLECVVESVVDPFLNKVEDAVTAERTRCTIVLETAPTP